ncbi:hypothetical protein IEO21_11037 [Rhodonia placenta]|uniref:Uncharacterized protein n=1 Tax=Rhodonia placenta TaxID=104341 RepID=A0A8H7NRF4_9APHY|nr:hypothetical protein IEO21_11037 [Postia placenta]
MRVAPILIGRSKRCSQAMDCAVVSLEILMNHSGAQYADYLKCEPMHSLILSSEEAVGYKAITWSCKDAWVILNLGAVACLCATVPVYLCTRACRCGRAKWFTGKILRKMTCKRGSRASCSEP